MAYATVLDVHALNGQRPLYDYNTVPTSQQVALWLDQTAAEIDSVLASQGLTVPAVLPVTFVTHLRHLNALGAAALAESSAFPEAAGQIGGSGTAERYWRMYREGLRALIDGSSIPPTSGTAGGRILAQSFGSNNLDELGNPPEPLFSMTQRF